MTPTKSYPSIPYEKEALGKSLLGSKDFLILIKIFILLPTRGDQITKKDWRLG